MLDAGKVHVLGVGNNTVVYIDLIEACGFEIAGLYHYGKDRVGDLYFGHKVVGTHDDLFARSSLSGMRFAVSVGDNKLRQQLANSIRERGGKLPTFIHPHASVSPYAEIEPGVVIQAGAVVQGGASICSESVVSFNAGVAHTSHIKKACYVACGAIVGAYITVEDRALVGMGSMLVSGKLSRVGEDAVIGAGSLVLGDVADSQVVAGSPAKAID